MTPGADLERIVGQAVRGLLAGPQRLPAACDSRVTRVPLQLRGAQDVALLLSWFRRLCADDAWRQRFLSGQLELDISVPEAAMDAATSPARNLEPAGAPAIAPVATPRSAVALDDAVVTEAVLRRWAARDDLVLLTARAVITPSARDYARTAGIRMERKV